MPKGPTMRPITTRLDSSPAKGPSRGAEAPLPEGLLGGGFLLAGDLALATLDQLLHRSRGLRALVDPMGYAIQRQSELGLGFGGLGIVEADALDEAPVARH